jgi:hypothetical protein
MFSLLLFLYAPFNPPGKARPRLDRPTRQRTALRLVKPPASAAPSPQVNGKDVRKRRKAKDVSPRIIEGGRAGVP